MCYAVFTAGKIVKEINRFIGVRGKFGVGVDPHVGNIVHAIDRP